MIVDVFSPNQAELVILRRNQSLITILIPGSLDLRLNELVDDLVLNEWRATDRNNVELFPARIHV